MLIIEDCVKRFKDQIIFDHASLRIDEPGLYALSGHSGCGKSTLLNMIAGYELITSGKIIKEAEVMTIFQNYELIDELNVYDNIFLERKEDDSDREILRRLGLDALLKQYPNELSGGQKQRVGIARALISRPKIICCDEPTESLDITNKTIVMEILKEYSRDHIVIMATHQQDTIDTYADAVIRIKDKQLIMNHMNHRDESVDSGNIKAVEQRSVKPLISKITQKNNMIFLVVFIVLLSIAEITSVMKHMMFHIPDTVHTVNADMIYVQTNADGKTEEKDLQDLEKIVRFSNTISVDDIQYQINVYPYVETNDSFQITGDIPKGMNVLINQNAAESLLKNNMEGSEITLSFYAEPYSKDEVFNVTGVVQEDTDAINIYYDLYGFMDFLKDQRIEDGRPYSQLIEESGTYFQKKVGYDRACDLLKNIKTGKSLKLNHPLYEERKTKEEQGRIYRYMFTAFVWIIIVLLTAAVWILTQKETESHKKSFAILISQNIRMKDIHKEYIRKKMIPVFVFAVIDLIVLFLLKMKWNQLNIVPLFTLVGVETVIYLLAIENTLSDMKPEKISQMLKEMNG